MNDEVLRFIWIIAAVAGLTLLGEGLHRIFRAAKPQPPKNVERPLEYRDETFEDRFSIRHLERLFLTIFVCLIAFLLLLTRGSDSEVPILSIGIVGFWWSFRRGVLR
jgi:hypothetical protein